MVRLILLLVLFAHVGSSLPLAVQLVSGLPTYDIFGRLQGYRFYAEERSLMSPAPIFEVFRGSQKLNLIETIIRPSTMPKRKRHNGRRTVTITPSLTVSKITPTPQFARLSHLEWYVAQRPMGSTNITGPKRIFPTASSQFILDKFMFDVAGTYNVIFNITIWSGERFSFNRTIRVDPQPTVLRIVQFPSGFNGSALNPAPKFILEDWRGRPIATKTPVVSFSVISSTVQGQLTGVTSVQPGSGGHIQMNQIIFSLPGDYNCRVSATLSDGSTLSTSVFRVSVARALPQSVVVVQPVAGVAGLIFGKQPIFQVFDSVGISYDPRLNVSLSLGFNSPSFSYEDHDTIGTLRGHTWILQNSYSIRFSDLWVDLPGSYTIIVSLIVGGEEVLKTSISLQIAHLPSFEIPIPLSVNTLGVITLHGVQPRFFPVELMLSGDAKCTSRASDIIDWPPETRSTTLRNISIVSYRSGRVYMCIRIPSQEFFTTVVQYYLQRFNEPFPYVISFPVKDIAQCLPLTSLDEFRYRLAGWNSATKGRSYGCHLSPPVSGTIPPCTCSQILTCQPFTHPTFHPPNLDIGFCVCCKPWVMALAGTLTSSCLAAVLLVIYKYV